VAKKLNRQQEESFARQVAERECSQDLGGQNAFWRELMTRRDRAMFLTPELREKFERKQRTCP
jgi:hypothetical protein